MEEKPNCMLRPIISEKSLKQVESQNEYTFEVSPALTKHDIRKLAQDTFGVHVKSVRTKMLAGKTRASGKKRRLTRGQNRKLAIVRLDKKDKIALFEVKEGKK